MESLELLAPNSVDAIVTDPPYGLSFMGKKWDYDVPSKEFWVKALRVLKPGGYVLSFSGTRTYHRMVCNIEDAGFEIRDQIMWLYGSGFPKSHDVAKSIDKKFGARKKTGKTIKSSGMNKVQIEQGQQNYSKLDFDEYEKDPVTDEAKHWAGWGTALKPANEPIVMARKPLSEKTIVDNVLKWCTGGINIDGCRVSTNDKLSFGSRELGDGVKYGKCKPTTEGVQNAQGRWPANVILDEVAAQQLDEQTGVDSGGASRFFYTAKTSKSERSFGLVGVNTNDHPTVKPTDLMRYLIRLITPKNGVVLDPFMGSGSTGVAAIKERVSFIGMEMDPEYFKISETRINKLKQAVSVNTNEKKEEVAKNKAKIFENMKGWRERRARETTV